MYKIEVRPSISAFTIILKLIKKDKLSKQFVLSERAPTQKLYISFRIFVGKRFSHASSIPRRSRSISLRLSAVWKKIYSLCLVSKLPRKNCIFLSAWLNSYEYFRQPFNMIIERIYRGDWIWNINHIGFGIP